MKGVLAKDGSLVCPAFLDFARRLGCAAGRHGDEENCDGAVEAHHWPPKGSSGVTRDDRVIPLCRRHHDMAQRYMIPRERQDEWVAETRSLFMERSTPEEWTAYLAARKRWSEDRSPMVPI